VRPREAPAATELTSDAQMSPVEYEVVSYLSTRPERTSGMSAVAEFARLSLSHLSRVVARPQASLDPLQPGPRRPGPWSVSPTRVGPLWQKLPPATSQPSAPASSTPSLPRRRPVPHHHSRERRRPRRSSGSLNRAVSTVCLPRPPGVRAAASMSHATHRAAPSDRLTPVAEEGFLEPSCCGDLVKGGVGVLLGDETGLAPPCELWLGRPELTLRNRHAKLTTRVARVPRERLDTR
jgi:hypothetical protein